MKNYSEISHVKFSYNLNVTINRQAGVSFEFFNNDRTASGRLLANGLYIISITTAFVFSDRCLRKLL